MLVQLCVLLLWCAHVTTIFTAATPLIDQSDITDILQSEPDVTKFLHMVGNRVSLQWRPLGAYLGVPHNELQKIAHSTEPSDKTCCTSLVTVIEYWKNHLVDRPPTWNELITAVGKVDETLTITIKHHLVSERGQVLT